MTNNDRVAANVRAAIHEAEVSMLQLSKATGIARTTLTEQVNGDAKMSVDTLLRVAVALDVHPGDLLAPRRGRPRGRVGGRAA